jgi:hypothetical protein
MVKRLALAIAVAVLVAAAPVSAGVESAILCNQAKYKAAGKKAFDLLKAFGKNTKKSDTAKLVEDIARAQSSFKREFSTADTLGSCPFPGDAADVGPAIDDCVSDVIDLINLGTTTTTTTTTTLPTTTTTLVLCGNGVLDGEEQCDPPDYGGATCESLGFNLGGTLGCTPVCQYDLSGCGCEAFPATGQKGGYPADKNDGISGPVSVPDDGTVKAGAPLAYVDNGDGTITDLNTGLMWEKKSNDSSLHDRDNTYYWSGNGTQETIWDWLDDVNAQGGTGFAGYGDWRIPNAKELQSIIDYGRYNPSVDPMFSTSCPLGCTVQTCSCTGALQHWSSTTVTFNSRLAWSVGFYLGDLLNTNKGNSLCVRAVRGGF